MAEDDATEEWRQERLNELYKLQAAILHELVQRHTYRLPKAAQAALEAEERRERAGESGSSSTESA